jgi:ferritin-like metal-binding protein YciE
LRKLYIDELKDLYSAEKQLVKALPKMAKAASSPELKRAFEKHLQQTQVQVERLDQVFEGLEASPRGKKCVGMEGLIEEAQELIGEESEPEVLDAGLISKAQHVEHYEIAGYGTVRTYALLLGENDQASLLQKTLDEEGETDKLLTGLAESAINLDAALAGEQTEDREVIRGAAPRGDARNKKAGGTNKSAVATKSGSEARLR